MRKQGNVYKSRRKRAVRWQSKKLPIVAAFFVFVTLFMMFEIYHWQSFAGDAYAVRAMNQVINRHGGTDRITAPTRGRITDRNLQNLALSSVIYDFFVDVRMLNQRSDAEFEGNRAIFMDFFGWTAAQFNEMLARDTHHFVFMRGATYEQRLEFEAWLEDSPFFTRDIHFEQGSRRNYIHNNLAAPVLGFQRGLWWGLEHHYNHLLEGYAGRNMTVFGPEGNIVTERINPIHGFNIVTTLDLRFQRFAEDLVQRWATDARAGHGSIIVMNPHTGEVLAMAQYPSFDANSPADINLLTSPNSTQHLQNLQPDSEEFFDYLFRIWANFNVSATFEPGSIYKSFTAAKALDAGVITTSQMFYCTGFVYRAGHRIHCWIYPRTHGQLTLTQALAVSCNVAHIYIAEALGRYGFWQYQRDFGFGTITGIDLPGENAGVVFTAAELNASELATSSFGQRFTTTPIQSISAFASLVNGGNIVRPHVVSQAVCDNNNVVFTQNTSPQRRVITPSVSNWLRRAMAYTVTDGTARNAIIDGFTQGGKTGTAEQGLQESPDFTWSLTYIGYFPVEQPRYIIQVLLHEVPPEVYDAGFTSVVPMYREMMSEIIAIRGMLPDTQTTQAANLPQTEFVENFVGMGVQQAINRLNTLGRGYTFIGSGNVVASQFPPATTRSVSDSPIILHLESDGTTPLTPVPDVVGQPLNFAREILEQSGFTPRIFRYNLEEEGETVHAQTGQGVALPAGTDILITIR